MEVKNTDAVRVRLLSGSHVTPDGMKHRPPETVIESGAVYNAFKDKFELLGHVDGDAPAPEMPLPPNATMGAIELIQEHGVDWANINGSGGDGRITKTDVEKYIQGK